MCLLMMLGPRKFSVEKAAGYWLQKALLGKDALCSLCQHGNASATYMCNLWASVSGQSSVICSVHVSISKPEVS